MKKLITNAGMMAGILTAGLFMEIQQEGEGFLKLTLLCVCGLGCYFFYLCVIIFRKKYEVLEGEITWIQICKGRKKLWEIGVTDGEGATKQLLIPVQSGVRKGKEYRFFLKNDELLGVEEM